MDPERDRPRIKIVKYGGDDIALGLRPGLTTCDERIAVVQTQIRSVICHRKPVSRRLDRAPFRYSAQWQAQGLCHRNAVAGGEIAIRVNGLQTDMRGASREMRPQTECFRMTETSRKAGKSRSMLSLDRPDWRTIVYQEGHNLFGPVQKKAKDTSEKLLEWYRERLKGLFGNVSTPRLIKNTRGNPLYYLIWAGPHAAGLKGANYILGKNRTTNRG